MKKIILYILTTVLFTLSAFSADFPRWVGLPIYVYIPDNGYYSELMQQAFQDWENGSEGIVRFRFVNKQSDANLEVEFVDFVSNCNEPNAVGCTELVTKGRHFYKGYITIGTKEYNRDFSDGHYKRSIVTRPKEHIYGVMLHEIGHSIGLKHSKSSTSIMYPYDLDSMQYLTEEDIQLLYNKYH